MTREEKENGLPDEPDSPGGGEQDPEENGSDSSLEKPREGSGTDKPDSPGGGQS